MQPKSYSQSIISLVFISLTHFILDFPLFTTNRLLLKITSSTIIPSIISSIIAPIITPLKLIRQQRSSNQAPTHAQRRSASHSQTACFLRRLLLCIPATIALLGRVAAIALLRRVSAITLLGRVAPVALLRRIALLAVATLGGVSSVALLLLRVTLLLVVFATTAQLAQKSSDTFGLPFSRGQLSLIIALRDRRAPIIGLGTAGAGTLASTGVLLGLKAGGVALVL